MYVCERKTERGGRGSSSREGGKKERKKEKVKDRHESESMVRERILERCTTVAMKLLQEQRHPTLRQRPRRRRSCPNCQPRPLHRPATRRSATGSMRQDATVIFARLNCSAFCVFLRYNEQFMLQITNPNLKKIGCHFK